MLLNKLFNSNPYIVHAPGDLDYSILWHPIKKSIIYSKQENVKHLNIFTCSSYKNFISEKELDTFPNCCKKYNYEFTNLLYEKEWNTNRIKILLTLEHLKKSNSEFVLSCDSNDVLIVRPLKDIIDKFLSLEADIIFNAEIRFWPYFAMKEIKSIEDEISKNYKIFRYLNAGLWIGKRKEAINFFDFCYNNFINLPIHPKSEQVCIKHTYVYNYPKIKIDHQCKIFQNLNLVGYDILELL